MYSFMYYFMNWYIQAGYVMIIIKDCVITCLLKSPAPCSVSLQTQHWSRQSESFLNCSKSPNSCIQYCSKFFLASIFHAVLNFWLKSSYFFFHFFSQHHLIVCWYNHIYHLTGFFHNSQNYLNCMRWLIWISKSQSILHFSFSKIISTLGW